MIKILAIGDSNTWGYISGTLNWTNFTYQQFPYHQRWTGILERELGPGYSLMEEALPGRTIMTDDAQMPDVNSFQALEKASPEKKSADLAIILLGTNDLKTAYQLSPAQIKNHMAKLCHAIHADILLLSPPLIRPDKLSTEWKPFYANRNIEKESLELTSHFQDLAEKKNYLFCDASRTPFSDLSDGLHLDQPAHQWLALKIKKALQKDKQDASQHSNRNS